MPIAITMSYKLIDVTQVYKDEGREYNTDSVNLISYSVEGDDERKEFGDFYCCTCGVHVQQPKTYYVQVLDVTFEFVICDQECFDMLNKYVEDNWVIVKGWLSYLVHVDDRTYHEYVTFPVNKN